MALSGTLDGLAPLSPGDLDRYKEALAAGAQTGWGYYFLYLLAKQKPGRDLLLLGEDAGSLCLFHWKAGDGGPRLDLAFPPAPLQLPVLDRCLERANEYNRDRSARIMRIDEHDAAALSGHADLRLRQRRTQYLYAPERYTDLSGRRFRTLRRQVAAAEEAARLEVQPWRPEKLQGCLDLLRSWQKEHRRVHGTAGGVGTTRRALELGVDLPDPDLRGELVYRDGELVAFAFGGEIRPGVACFFDAKADPSVPGLGYWHRHRFLLGMQDFELVNDGSDTGREGLRQLKDSFRPVAMHPEFRARQR